MEASGLKLSLIDKLVSISDDRLLQKIDDLIGSVDLEKTEIRVTGAQKQMLMQSEDDIRNGKTITDNELNEEENKWLNG